MIASCSIRSVCGCVLSWVQFSSLSMGSCGACCSLISYSTSGTRGHYSLSQLVTNIQQRDLYLHSSFNLYPFFTLFLLDKFQMTVLCRLTELLARFQRHVSSLSTAKHEKTFKKCFETRKLRNQVYLKGILACIQTNNCSFSSSNPRRIVMFPNL